MKDFEGRTAVVTGAASGIGNAVAVRLGQEGMNLVLADIEERALAEAVEKFEADGVPVLGVVTDVADFSSVSAMAEATAAHFGDVHVLFNNAGVSGGGLMLTPDDLDMWNWVLGVDLYGVLHGIKAFGPAMVEHGAPCHMINTASMAGLLPTPALGAYTVAKYGVVAMSETLSLETRDTTQLRVSVLCPGFVSTNIHESRRNMPEHLVSLEGPTEEAEFMRAMVRDLVAGGLAPAEVADVVFDAIVADRFYVLPHPHYADQILARAEGIGAGAPPLTWEF